MQVVLQVVDDHLILKTLEGSTDIYKAPLKVKDDTVVKERILKIVSDKAVMMEEACSILHQAMTMNSMVREHDLGISGWKTKSSEIDINKKMMSDVLLNESLIIMRLFLVKQHLEWQPEHPNAPSSAP